MYDMQSNKPIVLTVQVDIRDVYLYLRIYFYLQEWWWFNRKQAIMSSQGRESSNGISAKASNPDTKKSKDAASGPDGKLSVYIDPWDLKV